MNLLKVFDNAVAEKDGSPRGYQIDGKINYSYMSNEAWDVYRAKMCEKHKTQFGGGSGGELEPRNTRPPKMASFASSSRMTYLLSKDIPGFVFEYKLSTVIGGIANLDGYCEKSGKYIFVEAKCREPYSHKSPQNIKQNYKGLYEYLQRKMPDVFTLEMVDVPETRDMSVRFFCKGEEVIYFDIKQMLCHLLGVANKMLTEKLYDNPVQFVYLYYDPSALDLPADAREEILRIYSCTCKNAVNYDFSRFFGCVVDLLIETIKYCTTKQEAEKLKKNFRFALCDQHTYRDFFNE